MNEPITMSELPEWCAERLLEIGEPAPKEDSYRLSGRGAIMAFVEEHRENGTFPTQAQIEAVYEAVAREVRAKCAEDVLLACDLISRNSQEDGE